MNRARLTEIAYFLLRVVSGLLFLQAGGRIVLGWFGGMPEGSPPLVMFSQTWWGGWIELIGGTLILLGLGTRVAAFICSGTMAVAYWQFHAPRGGWPGENDGIPAVLFCFIFLYIAAHGAGEWSLDALIRRWRARSKSSAPPARS